MDYLLPVLTLAGGILGGFLGSYLKEKGKNIATKEDIGGITVIVEKIRSDHAKEQDLTKAQLQMLVNVNNSMHSDLKKAVVDFWDAYIFLVSLCDAYRSEVEEERISGFDMFYLQIENASNEIVLKQARLHFFVKDEELIELSEEMLTNSAKMAGKFSIFLLRVKPLLEDANETYHAEPWDQQKWRAIQQTISKTGEEYYKEVEPFEDAIEELSVQFKIKAHNVLAKENILV